jgi:catechol 2,3-dioxygenase-like lactoylglutathione lyase family enzyme
MERPYAQPAARRSDPRADRARLGRALHPVVPSRVRRDASGTCDAGWIGFDTDDGRKTYEELKARGVEFTREPVEQDHGIDCALRDPFGNTIRIVQPKG